MAKGRPKKPVVLREEDRQQLSALARSRSLPHGLVNRARLVLMAADGLSNATIADKLDLSQQSVCLWRKRYVQYGLQGLHDELKAGRPRSVSDEMVAALVRKTLQTFPKDGTHWTIRNIARETRLSRPTVHRIWQAFGLQPHRQRHFKLSTDPFFVEKVRDIVGLYVSAPENAVVLCVDEKSQIQALERTQPMLPMGLGYVEGVTHDYHRHGTTTLFAALDIANGDVIAQRKPKHRHPEYLSFLKHVDENVPPKLDVGKADIFVFSDDINWCRENLSSTQTMNFVTQNKATNSFRDMQLMRACRHNIVANSSFSWWGAWLNTNENNMVIAPKKWFNVEDPFVSFRTPAKWIRF